MAGRLDPAVRRDGGHHTYHAAEPLHARIPVQTNEEPVQRRVLWRPGREGRLESWHADLDLTVTAPRPDGLRLVRLTQQHSGEHEATLGRGVAPLASQRLHRHDERGADPD